MHHRVWWEGSRSFGLPLSRNRPWVMRRSGYETLRKDQIGDFETSMDASALGSAVSALRYVE